jgi:hypothetical protein
MNMVMLRHQSADELGREIRAKDRHAACVLAAPESDWTTGMFAVTIDDCCDLLELVSTRESVPGRMLIVGSLHEARRQSEAAGCRMKYRVLAGAPNQDWRDLREEILEMANWTLTIRRPPPETLAAIGQSLAGAVRLLARALEPAGAEAG